MTETESMFNENYGLVLYTIKQYYPGWISDDDVQQEGAIGLWYACNNYKENGDATFAHFAVSCIRLHVHQYLRNNALVTKKPELPNASLDQQVTVDESLGSSLYELVKGYDFEWLDAHGLYLSLTPRQQTILKARLAGKECREIEKIVGISHTTLSKELKTIRQRWDEYI